MNDGARSGRHWMAIAATLVSLAAGEASAQLYKCKGPDGKTVYSDRRCEASDDAGKLAPGVSNRAHEIEEKATADKAAAEKEAEQRRLDAEARVAAERKYDAAAGKTAPARPLDTPATASGALPAASYAPTSSERERLRDLEITAGSAGAFSEQKTAAQLQMSSIRQGRESRLSAADRERRESLTVDLSSTDAKKRAQALRELKSIYYR